MAIVLCMVATLAGCTPRGVAVGNSHDSSSNVAHDSVDRQDIVIGVVGALGNPPVADTTVLNDLAKAKPRAKPSSPSGSRRRPPLLPPTDAHSRRRGDPLVTTVD